MQDKYQCKRNEKETTIHRCNSARLLRARGNRHDLACQRGNHYPARHRAEDSGKHPLPSPGEGFRAETEAGGEEDGLQYQWHAAGYRWQGGGGRHRERWLPLREDRLLGTL